MLFNNAFLKPQADARKSLLDYESQGASPLEDNADSYTLISTGLGYTIGREYLSTHCEKHNITWSP
jgi:hypothetical protein